MPVIDVAPLVDRSADASAVAEAIDRACREHGFFYIVGHGVSQDLQRELDDQARALFALPAEAKAAISMERGGPAWRGWFPLGGELTSGRPDGKEGFYVGGELPASEDRKSVGEGKSVSVRVGLVGRRH